uniref:Alpha-N-acetylgalactosaminide alpha-2,6-sialyltransferase 5 n=1 Tax=Ficedula albicollis TaxID=59894 RepID=A0A803W2E1_FICAL
MIKHVQFSLCAGGFSDGFFCWAGLFFCFCFGLVFFWGGYRWALLGCFVVVVCCFSKTLRYTPSARYYFLEGYQGTPSNSLYLPHSLFRVVEGKMSPLKMHCRSCALVTSSGHLLGSRQGHRIDQSECVIRMNDAPTRGYGRDVGNKTSLRVIAHSSIQRILRNRNELLNMSHGAVFIFWGPSSYMRRDGKGLVYNNLQLMNQILPQLKVYMISRHKMLQFDDLFKRETGKDRKISNTWLSTGWFTMTIALELCDRINVYGMVPPDFCRDPNHLSVPYHYYEPLGPDECTMYLSHERGRKGSHHRFITEKRVFENWARTFDIRFFQPDWKPEPLPVTQPALSPLA